MPLTLAKVLGATASTTFEFAGESCTLTYHPAAVSPKLLADLAAAGAVDTTSNDAAALEAASEAMQGVASALSSLLAGWDLAADDAGTPYPTDAASLATLPMLFLLTAVGAILGDLKLGESKAATAPTAGSLPSNGSSPQSSLGD